MKPYYQDESAGITIYNCDCREILPTILLVDEIDLALTDPPYGQALANHGRNDGRRRRTDFAIVGDESGAVGQAVIDSLQEYPLIAFSAPMLPWKGSWDQYLVWDKGLSVGGGGDPETRWKFSWEMIQVSGLGPLTGQRDGSVLRFHVNPMDSADHPAEKPLSLVKYLLKKAGYPRTVVDPFCGTGTTIVAAKSLGLSAVGIEIEERYCEIAARRLSQEVLDFGPVNKPDEWMAKLGAEDNIKEEVLELLEGQDVV